MLTLQITHHVGAKLLTDKLYLHECIAGSWKHPAENVVGSQKVDTFISTFSTDKH